VTRPHTSRFIARPCSRPPAAVEAQQPRLPRLDGVVGAERRVPATTIVLAERI